MPIHPSLANFVGYGGPRARFLFIGVEERNVDDDQGNLTLRETFEPRMDLRDACDQLFGPKWWDSHQREHQPVWCTASKIIAAIDHLDDWQAVRDESLGRKESQTLLAELLPVPLNASGGWGKEQAGRFEFPTYARYVRSMIGTRARPGPRTRMLRELIRVDAPEYVLCYGSSFLRHYQRVFPQISPASWREHWSKPDGYAPQKFHVAQTDNTRIAVTRHYSSMWGRAFAEPDIPALIEAFNGE